MKGMYKLNIAIVISLQILVQVLAQNKQAALVFNRFTSSLYDIPSSMPKVDVKVCHSWANACPAEKKAEKKFVKTQTITENALIVKQICEKKQTQDSAPLKRNICKYGHKIVALFRKNNWSFEFGYEIYFRMRNKEYFHTFYDRTQYIKPEDLFKSLHAKMTWESFLHAIKEVNRSLFVKDKIVWFNDDHKMYFMWIRLFKIKFDFFHWTPEKITYEIRDNNKWPVSWSCEKYSLAEEAYKGVGLDELYAEANQENIFSNLLLLEKSSEAACGGKNGKECLSKWLLIPIDQFHFGSYRDSICSNMATVPLWSSTLELVMKKLDKFLYALFRELGTGLYITSGIHGTLHLPKIKSGLFKDKTAAVYLDFQNSKIPAPDIIFKIVKYKLPKCSDKSGCWLSATVILHNDPHFEPTSDKKVCKQDVTSDWGWDEVTKFTKPALLNSALLNSEFKSKYIYVCQTNSVVLDRIGQGKSWWRWGKQKVSDFNLKEFPKFDNKKKFYQVVPIEQDVIDRILTLTSIENEVRQRLSLQGLEEGGENGSGDGKVNEIRQLTELIDPPPKDTIIERPQARPVREIVDEGNTDDEDGEISSTKAHPSSPADSDDDSPFSTPLNGQSYRGSYSDDDEFFQGDGQQPAASSKASDSPGRHRSPNRGEKSTTR
ncbi:uncharacterized protein LOC135848920 [Planococcus citri]|uniref:uncharacterized protein LOC135848920 n=1 Tax=Planococcus citri TaxID=170843 RepID=UPI0031F89819